MLKETQLCLNITEMNGKIKIMKNDIFAAKKKDA